MTDTNGQKGRKALPPHPATGEGKPKLQGIPQDYDPAVHKTLKEDDFDPTKADVYYDYVANLVDGRIEKAEKQLESLKSKKSKFLARAEAFRKTGSFEERAKANRLVELQLEMERLTAELVEKEGAEKVQQLQQSI